MKETDRAGAVRDLIGLMRRFLIGEIDGPTFDRTYRHAFFEFPDVDRDTCRVLEQLAFVCSEYVEIPELREPGDVDDEALVEAARTALAKLRVS